jgi:hypothetical protein
VIVFEERMVVFEMRVVSLKSGKSFFQVVMFVFPRMDGLEA